MIYEREIRAVDPIQLAVMSGAQPPRRFAAPTPPVVRPFLLTQQMRGCSCHDGGMAVPPDYGRLAGLGYNATMDLSYGIGMGKYILPEEVVGMHGLRNGVYIYPDTLGFLNPDPSTFDMNALQVPSATDQSTSGNISALQTIAVGANFIPGVGQIASVAITTFTQILNQFQSWFGIGAGRREADVIVPVQNNLTNALGQVTNQIRTGQSPSPDQLAALYRQVWIMGVAFQEFVLMRQFTDRRASGQALNTIMPYLDGSCGYPVPVGFTATPSQFNCLPWGDGTVGNVGTNGMLGAIGRAITAAGGSIPTLPDMHQAANSGIPPSTYTGPGAGIFPATIMGVSTPLAFAIGMAVLFAYKRGLF